MSAYQTPEGIEIKGKFTPEYAEILTPEALAFFAKLQRKHNARRKELLQKRVERQVRLDAGELPDFLPKPKKSVKATGRLHLVRLIFKTDAWKSQVLLTVK